MNRSGRYIVCPRLAWCDLLGMVSAFLDWRPVLVHRYGIWILALLALLMGVLSRGAIADSDDICTQVERVTLECGIEIVVFDDPSLVGEPVQVWARIHRGSMSEMDDERGASMLAARAAMQGLGDRSREEMLSMVGAVDGEFSDSHGVLVLNDHVVFMFEDVNGNGLDELLGAARELVDGYSPSEEAIERVREGMQSEIDEIDAERGERWGYRNWLPDLLDGSGMSRSPLPLARELESIDSNTVRRFIEREWVASQASVLVVGDVEAQDVIAHAQKAFDQCGKGRSTPRSVYPIIKESVSGRVATMGIPGIEGSRVGMVWFDPEREIVWDDEELREVLVLALTGESMRYRVNRLLRSQFVGVRDATVDVGVMMGRIRFGQIVAEIESEEWDQVLESMERERLRLIRDGLSEREIQRGRELLIQQWGYETDQWHGSTSSERARMLSWLMASGRPLTELEAWVGKAQELVVSVGVDEVNSLVKELFDSRDPAVVVVLGGVEDTGISSSDVVDVLDGIDVDGIVELGDWMDGFTLPLLDRSGTDAVVSEVSVHRASGTVSATLENGVVIHARRMVDSESSNKVSFVVRLDFGSIEDPSMHGVGDVLAYAIEDASIRSRTAQDVRGFMVEHGITMEVLRGALGLEIAIETDVDHLDRAVELVWALLTDLRIEQGMIDKIAEQAQQGKREIGVPIGAMEAGIGESLGVVFALRDPYAFGDALNARSVREWISQTIRGNRIEVGIAGGLSAQSAIEQSARSFGEISHGIENRDVRNSMNDDVLDGEGVVRIEDPDGRSGVLVGFSGCEVSDIDDLRAMIVAGLVLDARLEERFGVSAEEESRVTSGAMILDVMPGQVVVFGRVDCDESDWERVGEEVSRVLDEMSEHGIHRNEIEMTVGRIDQMLSRGIDRTDFWAQRLSGLSEHDLDIDAIWGIREGYRTLSAERVGEVFRKWYLKGTHFTVEFEGHSIE